MMSGSGTRLQVRADPVVFHLAGALAVKRVNGVPTVFPRSTGEVSPSEDLLQTVYDHGPVPVRISLAWLLLLPVLLMPAWLVQCSLAYSMQPTLLNAAYAASKLWLYASLSARKRPGDQVWCRLQVEWESFDALRERVNQEWRSLPPVADVISQTLKEAVHEAVLKLGDRQ